MEGNEVETKELLKLEPIVDDDATKLRPLYFCWTDIPPKG